MKHEDFFGNTINDIYDVGFIPKENGGESFDISHWGSKETQENNFITIVRMLEGENIKSLLDVGCGLGDLKKFLPNDIEYYGIDIVENIVKMANDRNPDTNVKVGDIFTYDTTEKFDAVVCNGAFNLMYNFDKVIKALEIMHELSKKITILTISYIDDTEVNTLKTMGYAVLPLKSSYNNRGDDYVIYKPRINDAS